MRSYRGIVLISLLALLLLGSFRNAASAQEIRLEKYSVNEGLSQSTVTTIYQDKQGYIWVGTGYGLNRFDGYGFTVFKNDPYDPYSISDNSIRGIVEDTVHKVMWVGTDNGLNRFDYTTGKFVNILANDRFFSKWCVSPQFTDGEKLWFFIPMLGIHSYHTVSGQIKRELSYSAASWANPGFDKYELWFEDTTGVLRQYNCRSGKISSYPLPDPYKKLPMNEFLQTSPHEGLLINDTGILKLDITTGQFTDIFPGDVVALTKNRIVKNILRDKHGNTWLSILNEGLYLFDKNWNLLRSYKKEFTGRSNQEFSFEQNTCLASDRAGNILVGSNTHGLGCLNTNAHFTPSLQGIFVKCFYKDEVNRLWIGTFNEGIFIIDRNTGKTIRLFPDGKNGMQSATITTFFEDRDGHLLIGTENGLMIADKVSLKFTEALPVESSRTLIITAICQTKDGTIWLGTQKGLYRVRLIDKRWTLEQGPGLPYSFSSLYEDSKGSLIAGLVNVGLYVMKPGKEPVLAYSFSEHKMFAGNMALRCFTEDNKGRLWAASDNGLVLFNEEYIPVKITGERNGLADNFIYGILKAANGELWYSSNKGIGKYDPVTGRCRNYSVEDGLQSREYNTRAFYKAGDGEFFFGGVNGYNSFYPDRITENPVVPGIVFSEFSVFGKLLDTADSLAHYNQPIILPYNENTVSFVLSALEYTDPSRNTYAYKLEGQDANFFNAGTERFVRYSGLAPGTYHFLAKAANADGVWGNPAKLFTLVITPPYWQTGWFRMLMIITAVVVTAATAYAITRWKYARRLATLEKQREIERVRNRISKDIHDDIGAGLTRIALISEAARMELKQSKGIDERLVTLSDSAREMSQSLREIVWSMNPGHDNMTSLLGYIRNYVLMFFDEADMQAEIHFPEQLPETIVSPDFRRNLFMIIKESCNNIAKHSKATKTSIEFAYEGEMFTMIIKDNGIGFAPGKAGSFSNGLVNMRKRAQEINCAILIDSPEGNGVSITVKGMIN